MRLTLSRHSWALISVCALVGCTTFDRPVATTRQQEVDPQDRLTEAVSRRTKAGDLEGARRLLEQAEEAKSVGRSHARSESNHSEPTRSETVRDSGIQQVGYQQTVQQGGLQTPAPTSEEMIRELLQIEPPEQQAQKAQHYQSLPFASLKQIYTQHRQAVEYGHQRNPQPSLNRNAALEAPNPRAGAFGGSSPWPTGVANNPGAPGHTTHPAATANNGAAQDVSQPVASQLAVTDNGVKLEGIQTGNAQVAQNGSSGDGLPAINPAGPGAPSLPTISPGDRTKDAGAGPFDSLNDSKIKQMNGAVQSNGPGATTAAGQVSTNTPNTRSAVDNGVAPAGSPAINGGPTTTPPGQAQAPRSATQPLDRLKPLLSNTLPAVAQSAKTAKNAFDPRSRGWTLAGQAAVDPAAPPAIGPLDQNENLTTLIQQLEAQLAAAAPGTTDEEKLKHVRNHVNLRMLYMIAGRNEQALEPIKGIEGDEQEFWQHMLWSVIDYFDAQGMPRAADRANQTLAELRTASQKLKSQADLQLRNVTFCQRIDSYGNFDRLSRDQFPPGSAVLLYAEVENFSTTTAEGDRQMTQLLSTIEIYKTGGEKPVHKIPFKVTQDFCRVKRQDFYLSFEFSIPQQLEAGVYSLLLKTEDLASKKVGSTRIQFAVE